MRTCFGTVLETKLTLSLLSLLGRGCLNSTFASACILFGTIRGMSSWGKKSIEGKILSHQLQEIGIIIEKSSSLSERLCKPCATKIRRTCELFSFMWDTINIPNPKFITVRKEIEVRSRE